MAIMSKAVRSRPCINYFMAAVSAAVRSGQESVHSMNASSESRRYLMRSRLLHERFVGGRVQHQ